MSEHFCYIAINKNDITLGVIYGSELSGPASLLDGTGKLYRHVKIRKPDDLKTRH